MASPTTVPTATPKATATPTPTPTPTPTLAPPAARAASSYLLLSPGEIASRPTSGAAWSALKARADRSIGTPDISNQDDGADITVLAKALVWARIGSNAYRVAVVDAIRAAVGTEAGGRTLALGRNLPGYVVAADLVDLASADPAFDKNVFRPWLRSLLTKSLDGLTLVATHETRPNNWGTHAGAARAAIARYLRDSGQLARTATVFRGWLGDRSAYAGFSWGDTSWQCDPAKPVGINPAGCTRDGHSLDGVLPDDQRRGGSYTWPAPKENYVWEALQGAALEAELLYQGGHNAWAWSSVALGRANRWLYDVNGFPAAGDDEWIPWLIDARTGTNTHGGAPTSPGKNFGFADWLYPS